MRRYVGCACSTSANDSVLEPSACDDFHNVTCGPIRRRRLADTESGYDVETWLEDLSMIADCDVSRSVFHNNDEVSICNLQSV